MAGCGAEQANQAALKTIAQCKHSNTYSECLCHNVCPRVLRGNLDKRIRHGHDGVALAKVKQALKAHLIVLSDSQRDWIQVHN